MSLSKIFLVLAIVWSFFGTALSREPIDQAFSLYISPKGQELFQNNLNDLLELNGLSLEEFYLGNQDITLEEKPLEDMVKDPELRQKIIDLKKQIERFFIGLSLGKHKFNVNAKELYLKMNWDQLSATFRKPIIDELNDEEPYTMEMVLTFESSDINFSIDEIRANDLNHPWLGVFGLDKFSMKIDESSQPFFLEIPVGFYFEKGKDPVIKVHQPMTNIDGLVIASSYQSPLVLPDIRLTINDHVVTLNLDELDKLFDEQKDGLIVSAQAAIQKWLNEDATGKINEIIAGQLDGLREVNQMQPPGAPTDRSVEPFIWTMDFQKFDFNDDNVHMGLGLDIYDPAAPFQKLVTKNRKKKWPLLVGTSAGLHDLTAAVHQDLVNRLVELSFNRGYFSPIEVDEGLFIKVTKVPNIIFENTNLIRTKLEIEHKVEGVAAVFVRNPVRVEFDLLFRLDVKPDGTVPLIVHKIDIDSVHIDDKYIRMFKDTVRKAVKKAVKKMEDEINGSVAADDLGLPRSVGGIPLKPAFFEMRKNQLFLHMDYDL